MFMGRPKKDKPNHKYGLYEYKITVGHTFDGKLIRKSFYSSKSKADAKARAEAYKISEGVSEQTGEAFVPKSSVHFKPWSEKWLESRKGTVKENSYQLTYKHITLNHLIPYFSEARLQDISSLDIQKYFNIKSAKLSKATLMKHKYCLSSIFETAIDDGIITRNPCRNIKLKDTSIHTEKRTYTQEQAEQVCKYAQTHRFGLGIIIMLQYGLTRSELLGLQWSDFDSESKTLHIQRDVVDMNNEKGILVKQATETKNRYRNRTIPLSDTITMLLNEQPRFIVVGQNKHKKRAGKQVECEYIIHDSKGEMYSPRNWSRRYYDVFMSDMHDYYMEQGLDIPILNPHELRHTCATLLVNSEKNLLAIAKLLGHSDLKMLNQVYAHTDSNAIREMLEI